METSFSNTLSKTKLNETFRKRPSEKFFEGKKILDPIFLSFNCVQTSGGLKFYYRLSLERIRRD